MVDPRLSDPVCVAFAVLAGSNLRGGEKLRETTRAKYCNVLHIIMMNRRMRMRFVNQIGFFSPSLFQSSSVDVGPLCVEALVGVGRVVDHLELPVAVEEAVAAPHVALVVLLLVAELAVVAAKKERGQLPQ